MVIAIITGFQLNHRLVVELSNTLCTEPMFFNLNICCYVPTMLQWWRPLHFQPFSSIWIHCYALAVVQECSLPGLLRGNTAWKSSALGVAKPLKQMIFQPRTPNFMKSPVHFNLSWPSSPTITDSTSVPGLTFTVKPISNTQFLHHVDFW